MISPQQQLEQAAQFHRMGKLSRAEEIYRSILDDNPQNADALHLLGVVLHQKGENESAAMLIRQAIALVSCAAEYHTNLGSVLLAMGKTDEAIDAYLTALKYAVDDSDIHFNLGNLYASTDRYLQAIESFRNAVRISPQRSEIWNNLGRMFQEVENWNEAAECYRNAMQLSPADFEPVNNLGVMYEKLGNDKTAFDCFCRAAQLCPTSSDVQYNAGNLARRLFRYEEACTHYRHAMVYQEPFTEASVNLAVTYLAMGESRKALDVYDHLLEEIPDHAETRFNKSLVLLRLKNFEEGWNEYEWRWKYGDTPKRLCSPEWDGSDLTGKSILVTAEQGIGDQIMFASCLPELLERAETVSVECEERLAPLFQRSYPDISFLPVKRKQQSLPRHRPSVDYEVPIGSLPRFLRTSENDFPRHTRFLFPDDIRRNDWIDRLSELDGRLKVGISWCGGKDEETRTMRSIPLARWPRFENVALVDLQYGDTNRERQTFFDRTGSRIHHFEEIDPLKELDDFAALISALDLVISIDNSTVHLAGAMGTPCSVLLPHYADWRWFLDAEKSLWYSSVRLFRQQSVTEWNAVFDKVLKHLASNYGIELRTSEVETLKFSPLKNSA